VIAAFPKDRRFNLIDPAGNRSLIGQKHASSKPIQNDQYIVVHPSRFTNAFETAYRLAYAKDEPAEAARVLDLVFSKAEEVSVTYRLRFATKLMYYEQMSQFQSTS